MSFWCDPFDQNSNEILTIITLLFWSKRCLHKIISVFTDLYLSVFNLGPSWQTSWHKVKKKMPFSEPPPIPMFLRNVKMVPFTKYFWISTELFVTWTVSVTLSEIWDPQIGSTFCKLATNPGWLVVASLKNLTHKKLKWGKVK